MITLTLTPNRSDAPRYTKTIHYNPQYSSDHGFIQPYGYRDGELVRALSYSEIKRQPADPEFRDAWLAHVEEQHAAAVKSKHCGHPGCNQRHDPPTTTRDDLIARGIVRPA